MYVISRNSTSKFSVILKRRLENLEDIFSLLIVVSGLEESKYYCKYDSSKHTLRILITPYVDMNYMSLQLLVISVKLNTDFFHLIIACQELFSKQNIDE